MFTALKDWKGAVEVNGVKFESIEQAMSRYNASEGELRIKLYPVSKTVTESVTEATGQFRITVKKYMTQKATPTFDFMEKWNNNVPMPLRTMIGEVVKETRGMVYMKLHGDIYAEKICTCMKCGRTLTNPVSQYFGIGPECGGHGYVNPFDSEEELKEAVAAYRKQLQNITWEGWVIKSAITEKEEV